MADFFSQAAGQQRRAWLEGLLGDYVAGPANKYLGPTGIPQKVNAAMQLGGLISPGADIIEAQNSSQDLMNYEGLLDSAGDAAMLAASMGVSAMDVQQAMAQSEDQRSLIGAQ